MAAFPEAPSWNEQETRRRLDMYNASTRCINRVAFPDANSAIGYFIFKPEYLPPYIGRDIPAIAIISSNHPYTGEIPATGTLVEGHFTSEYGISVVRGIDQLAAAIEVQRDNISLDPNVNVYIRLKRIAGPIKFSQPVVPGDLMIIQPSNLGKDALTGDSEILVYGSTVASFKGIEFERVGDIGDDGDHIRSEYMKTILIEVGAQTAVADFLYRRDFLPQEEQAKGDFLVYAGIKGPIEWYEALYPGQLIEARLTKDPQNRLQADVDFWADGRLVARTAGNECGIGNRERTKQLIERVVQRRRARVNF